MYVYTNCVCLPFQMVRGFQALGRVRRWVVVLGPHLPGSALCSRNLSFSLLRQCREHVKLWHMVARVTCSLWSFGPWSETVPPCMTPAVLHLPCSLVLMCFGPSIHLAGLHLIRYNSLHDFVYGSGGPHDKWCIEWNAHLQNSLFFCMFICVFAVWLSRQKADWASAIRSPSIYSSSTSQANLTFKSPTHMYWTAVLSPVQIWKRARWREGGWKEWNGKISQPLVTGWGAEKKSAQLSKPPWA